ncbi:MAG: type II toxin-antitoxin system VapC family toxin [Alphaproteobacteria bacterium]|nr:type II toxin-antitoxin system VapC family toxin [Alphaproteobacteria bacterium]
MGYLLDTNMISDLVRHRQGAVARHIREIGEEAIATSIIVAAELRFGAAKRGAQRLTQRIEAVLARLAVLPFAAPADAVYAALRVRLERTGRPIGGNDLLIAAHAVAGGHILVTDDRDFGRIAELSCENWLAA